MELTVIHLKGNGIRPPHRWWNDSKETGHRVLKNISALSCGIVKRRNKKDTIHFQCGCFEHRTLISNDSLCKSAQYLRSSPQADVKEFGSEAGWERADLGKFRDKRKWAATEECETASSKFFGANSKEWWSSIWKQIARYVFRTSKH